ncbi:hypothetical protein GCM10010983_48780 [Caulobacter rhizosphaerae]|nr:hypothetical protein GCM10010983_48780 [Caulobacter rhizosphaerae]
MKVCNQNREACAGDMRLCVSPEAASTSAGHERDATAGDTHKCMFPTPRLTSRLNGRLLVNNVHIRERPDHRAG